MQRCDETDQHRSETAWGRTRYKHPIDRAHRPSIDINPSTSIDIRSKPKTTVSERDKFNNEYLTPDEYGIFRDPDGHARAIDGRILNVSQKDIADILQTANGAENLLVHQRNIPEYQQKDTKEFYDAAGCTDKSFKLRSRHPTRQSIDVDVPTSVDRQPEFCIRAFDSHGTRKFYWEEKDHALTSKIEAIQGELVEIQRYIARRPEASSSIDKHNNKSTDIHHRTSVDDATNRGRLVRKMTSDMSDTHYHGEEISADTYATLRRHQFNLEMNFIGETGFQGSGNQDGNKKEKLQEGDFEVESLMSFGGSHWCRSTPDFEYRSTHTSSNRSTGSPEHRPMTPTESPASCNALRILTHEEFTAKHPHPPNPDNVRIARRDMPKIDVARLNALRPKPKPSENPPETVRTPSDDGKDPMEEDRIPTGRT
ncbi:hypothetical protein F2Q69_00007000 [Brassica cretica]|uniref:Uncharacterized protein n=1 Tax=Brassica cretica TaxID=69181 RepID=A0A8S9NK78_BRACR|nr:hypothetical protein F2Q69_00007000 [Brassica cretica]